MTSHKTVLLQEAIDGLRINPGDTIVDATIGGGGHSEKICDRIGESGTLLGVDEDEDAIIRTEHRLAGRPCRKVFRRGNFQVLDDFLKQERISLVNGILFDLGWSQFQVEVSGRGFSFSRNEPLLMTFSKNAKPGALTAYEIVNSWKEAEIGSILRTYGEERYPGRIARTIVEAREAGPIETTGQLAEIVASAVPSFRGKRRIHPATQTFQALRIAVNDELTALTTALSKAWDVLAPTGRIAVISFHSLEDRIVKNFFRDKAHAKEGILVTKKPIIAGAEELQANPRARSAKLRIIEKTS